MSELEKEFIPYEQALALKELGFDEPCLGYYIELRNPQEGILTIEKCENNFDGLLAPTFSQAFRWLYQTLGIEKGVMPLDIESQQLLLKELIDKVSSKHLLV